MARRRLTEFSEIVKALNDEKVVYTNKTCNSKWQGNLNLKNYPKGTELGV